jgi:glycosyltransferase involved in cell wall biosynthesis
MREAAVPKEPKQVSAPTTAHEYDASEHVDLSIYVITRKEDFHHLPDMIDSLPRGVELVIVETVPDKAKAGHAPVQTGCEYVKGRHVKTYTWHFDRWDFSSARNAALSLCTREWCMWMDSDDRIVQGHQQGITQLIPQLMLGTGGVMLGCHGYQPPYRDGERGSFYAVPHCRIHRNHPDIRWRGLVHEQIDAQIAEAGLQVIESSVSIIHVGYVTDAKSLTAKMGRNVYLLCRQIAEDRDYVPTYYLKALQDNITTYNDMKAAQNE